VTCRPLIVSVTEKDDSGHVTMREWATCAHTAMMLAAALGAPHRQTLLSPEAAAALNILDAQHPGVIVIDPLEG